jgi:hypothetical protein
MMKEYAAEDYYRACAAEMMAKAQSAPSKAIRQAYLNLALNWAQQANSQDGSEPETGPAGAPAQKN